MVPPVGVKQPVTEPQEHTLPGAIGPEDHGARPGVEHHRYAIDDAPWPDLEHDFVEAKWQQRKRGAHVHAITRIAAAPFP